MRTRMTPKPMLNSQPRTDELRMLCEAKILRAVFAGIELRGQPTFNPRLSSENVAQAKRVLDMMIDLSMQTYGDVE